MKQLFFLIFVLALALAGYFAFPFFRAEFLFQKSLTPRSLGEGGLTPQTIYNLQQQAIRISPRIDRYHRRFSQTTLALANSLLDQNNISTRSATNSAFGTLSAPSADKQKIISSLIPQAISEAKIAVKLNPHSAKNLENLGLIYKNLIAIIPDAKNFSLAYFRQAAISSPKSPEIQAQIGSVYLLSRDFDQAEKFYQNSLNLKPDYAVGFYGLSQIEKARGKNIEAMKFLSKALLYTPKLSADYIKIKNELTRLEGQK